ncbi:MAG: HEAT repeat domain-containing protein [Pirellulales bacterium]
MLHFRSQHQALAISLVALLAWLPAEATAQDDAAVRKAVERGIEVLVSDRTSDDRLGAQALTGLALLKHGEAADHPRIQAAVAAVRQDLPEEGADAATFSEMYSPALATIFLIELDPRTYRPEIERLLDFLFGAQKPHGGWGYPTRSTGDTSMTQYGVLAMWEAWHAGFPVPPESVAAVTRWLMATQDPGGGFGYQGKIAPGEQPVPQENVRHSLTAAALGSLYMCADMLGMEPEPSSEPDALPTAVRRLAPRQPKQKLEAAIDRRRLRQSLDRGNAWIKKNWTASPPQWTFYYLYALERYMTFREAADGKGHGLAWYAEGAAFLLQKQTGNGAWRGQAPLVPDTAFALLFLMRAMQSTVEKSAGLGAGLMVGGRGLPGATGHVEIRGGRVVARPLQAPAERLLAILEASDAADRERAVRQIAEMSPEDARRLFHDERERLRRLLDQPDAERRRAAVEALAAQEHLDAARWLIVALTDTDASVVRAARDGLRRLARRPGGFGLSDRPTDGEKALAARKWRRWYHAARPHVRLE